MPIARLSAILLAILGVVGLIWATAPSPAAVTGSTAASTQPDTFPSFDRMLLLESTSETSANVSIGDVNGDGHLDIVLAKGRHWPLVDRVLIGDGAGHFAPGYDLGTASDRSYSGRLADVDRDGDLDVIISNDKPDPKLVYLNDGKGHFRVGSAYGRPEWETRNATVTDLDGDGYPDIVAANRGDSTGANYVCLNRGDGRFDADCVAFSRYPATTITAADFNRDGSVDLAVPHRDGGQSLVYLAVAKGRFSNAHTIPFGPPNATIRMAEAADLDRDGLLDIVAIDEREGAAIYFGQRSGTFSSGVPVGSRTPTPYALVVGDVSGDGKTDIVIGNVEAQSVAYINDGSGRRFHVVRFGDDKGTVYGFAIADVNRDGLVDIAVARSDAPNVLYFGGGRKSPSPGAAPPPDTAPPTRSADSIVLERTACFGSCPTYRLSIAQSGRVVLTPLAGSRARGAMQAGTDSLSPRAFARLLRLADSAGFFALPDSTFGHAVLCTRVRTDAPSLIVTVYAAAGPKRVKHYQGCEGNGDPASAEPLRRLEAFAATIDRGAGTSRWAPRP